MTQLAVERPAPMRIWLMAARPRTLPAAIAPVLVGTAQAKRLIFTGAMIDAAEAERIGLVQEVATDGSGLDMARAMAARITGPKG